MPQKITISAELQTRPKIGKSWNKNPMWSPMKRETFLYRNDVICVLLVLWKEALKWNFDDINRFSKVSRETFCECPSTIELKTVWKANEISVMWILKHILI